MPEQAAKGEIGTPAAGNVGRTGEHVQRNTGHEHSYRKPCERPDQPGGGARAHPADPSRQLLLVLFVTTPLYRTIVSQALRFPLRSQAVRGPLEIRSHPKLVDVRRDSVLYSGKS
jgi:hypothetical protein